MALLSCSFDMMNSFSRRWLVRQGPRMAAWPQALERMATRRDYCPGNIPALRFLLSNRTA
jgi:hypothetical protein